VELPELLERLIDSLQEPLDQIGTALPALAQRVEDLGGELAATRASIDAMLPELSRLVGGMDGRLTNIDTEVTRVLSGLDERLGHMDDVVSELGGTLTGVLGSIPGVRRAVRSASGAAAAR
jgi:ABC-type transporter Mla subunit MlaD